LVLNLTIRLLLPKRACSHRATTTIGWFWNSTVDLPAQPDGRRRGVEPKVRRDAADGSRTRRGDGPELEVATGRGRCEVGDRLAVGGEDRRGDELTADEGRGRAHRQSRRVEGCHVQLCGLVRPLGADHRDQLLVGRQGWLAAAKLGG